MNWYLYVLKNYAQFNGRARRKEFWWFVAVDFLLYVILGMLDFVLLNNDFGFSGIYGLATLIPSLAVRVRRLHDIDRSGWWLLIGIIPVIGFIVLVVFACLDGTQGKNRFGEDPKNPVNEQLTHAKFII
ncbi:DUF805 domain-containing protein [Avibacterium paragallinarum]|uniref:DUF805 domain-containing protein n=1 Tax=Avibacterium paragallinarum TaxID=728 RepID=UPI00021AD1BD|nr:DUF805 domain-containing protein [Avibacterium paragallinarum]AZI14223.1 DUF805 domain-containing protein [Avibacterium paragallinarum]QIR11694.1 DUF805 domain-containing protein [Avibacterium paragallinarum]QJE09331.1 DUF805 domain-containing protein [Avibacterium paragallinarum]QJE11527.1 DUF805 domain-containing protein [Avibacterium paragallinarum]QJE13727.1 DUF805 domain-containing protein [Avibacterium paragallinarum]